MKTLEFIKLNESGANNVVASLQQLLADFQVYYTNLRGFHWNIKGHNFFVLHSQFEKMYDDTAEKVDEIAERILMLGGTPANKFSDYLKVANVNEVDKVSNGDEALNNILQSISYLIGEERKILSIASQAGDEVTVSMMSSQSQESSSLSSLLNAHTTVVKAFFRILRYFNKNTIIRKQLLNHKPPLNNAYSVSVKIFFIAYLVHLADVPDTVHIEMVKRHSSVVVFLHNRKCRAVNIVRHSKSAGKALCKNCLSGS